MKDSKLFDLLRSLNGTQRNALDKLMESPYFYKYEATQNLYLWVMPFVTLGKRGWQELDLSYTAVQRQWAAPLGYTASDVRRFSSQLLELVETYIVVNRLQIEPITNSLFLMDYYINTSLNVHYKLVYKTAVDYLSESEACIEQYFQSWQIEHSNIEFESIHDSTDVGIVKANNYLDAFYLVTKMRYILLHTLKKDIGELEDMLPFTTNVLHNVREGVALREEFLLLHLYYIMYDCFQNPSEENYDYILSVLAKNQARLSLTLLSDLYFMLEVILIRHFSTHYNAAIKALFRVYKTIVECNLILERDGILLLTRYNNFYLVGCKLKEWEWVDWFIEKYIAYIPQPIRDDCHNLARVTYLFYKGDYQKIYDTTASIKLKDPANFINIRRLLLSATYELAYVDESYDEMLLSQLDNYKRLLLYHKKNVPKSFYQSHFTFHFILRKICIYPNMSEVWRLRLVKSVETTPNLAAKDWLNEKLEEFKQRAPKKAPKKIK